MLESLLQQIQIVTGGNKVLFHALTGLGIVIAVIVSGRLVKWILVFANNRLIKKTKTAIDDEILGVINSHIMGLSSVIGLYLGMKELRRGLTKQNVDFLTFLEYADTLLYLVTISIVASIIIRISKTITHHTIKRIAEKNQHEELNKTLVPLVNRVTSIVVIALTCILVLEHFGQSVTSLLTILGAGSLALGLAAQDTISNMISGFIIMIDRPFRVGDRVKIPTGEVGDVYEIGIRSTKILDFDNNVLIVPNNELVKTKIINYGYPGNDIRVMVEVTVAYGSNVDQVKSIMVGTARAHPDVLADPQPEAFLMKLGDSALHFNLYCRVADFKIQFLTAEKLRTQIYAALIGAKIEIPYPQLVVHKKTDTTDALYTAQKRKKTSRKDR